MDFVSVFFAVFFDRIKLVAGVFKLLFVFSDFGFEKFLCGLKFDVFLADLIELSFENLFHFGQVIIFHEGLFQFIGLVLVSLEVFFSGLS